MTRPQTHDRVKMSDLRRRRLRPSAAANRSKAPPLAGIEPGAA